MRPGAVVGDRASCNPWISDQAQARIVQRGLRAALGASAGALRRTLLAESLLLCGAGAVLGVLLADPLVAVVGRYAARFSVRALDARADASTVWVGAGLAMAAAVALAYVPRLPSQRAPNGITLASSGAGITPGTKRSLQAFAITQIAFSFVLLAGAGMLLASLTALQTARTSFNLRQVLAVHVPTPLDGAAKVIDFFQEVTRRVEQLPGVTRVVRGRSTERAARDFARPPRMWSGGPSGQNDL